MCKTISTSLSYTLMWAALLVPSLVMAQYKVDVPTSPDAAAFAKVANYPMSTNTGLPDISIPLHEIEVGGMKLPITLNYHSGGFKTAERSTNVGLGWNLSCDIQITRTVNGVDDFDPVFGYATNTAMRPHKALDPADIFYVDPIESTTSSDSYKYATGLMDGKPDKFSYRLLNKSGSFYMVNNGGSYSFVPVPYENIQIAYNQNQFTITDVDGSIYYFSVPGNSFDYAGTGREVTGGISGGVCDHCVITTYKCMKIVNPTATDIIQFNYVTKSISTAINTTDFVEYFNNASTSDCSFRVYPNSAIVNNSTTYTNLQGHVNMQALSSPNYIEYHDSYGSLFHMPWLDGSNNNQFQDKTLPYDVLTPSRQSQYDVQGLALSSIQFRGGSVTFSGTDQLSAITINNGGQEVKTIRFYQSVTAPNNLTVARRYDGNNFNGTYYLDSISFTNGASKNETYGFQYKNKFCFGSHLKGHDAWGYVNAKTMEIAVSQLNSYPPFISPQAISQSTFNSICTPMPISFTINGYGDEFPDQYLMQSGMLSSISYPTGGHADFDFESNRYSVSASDVNGPSKRLLPGGGLRIQKITYYDGINLTVPASQQYFTYGDMEDGEGILLNPPAISNAEGTIGYGNYSFTQSIFGGIANTAFTAIGSAGAYPPLVQPCGSNDCIDLTTRIDKTTYLPNSALDLTYAGGSPIYYNKVTEYNLDYGRQTGKTVHTYYPFSNVPIYSIIPTAPNTIPGTDDRYLRENWFMGNLQSESYYKYQASSGSFALVHSINYEYTPVYAPMWPRVIYSFMHNFFSISAGGAPVGSYYLNTPYSTGNYLINTPNFIFSEDGIPIGKMLMTKKTEQWADDMNDTLSNVTQFFYNSQNDIFSSVSTDSRGLSKTTQFKHPYDYPSDPTYTAMVAKNMISPVIEKIVTDGYSREFARERTNYAYRNNFFYAPDSRYTSLNGHALELETSFDQYDNFGNLLSLTSRDGITKSYIWGYTSRYPVAEVAGTDYNTAVANSGINLTVVDNPTSDVQMATELNKLRGMPGPSTLVKTFTYKPMTGITSLTGPSGISSYFEYDVFNRLVDVRDNSHNIITKYGYSIQGPTTTPRFYTNHPLIGTVNNCFMEPSTGPGNNDVLAGGTIINSADYAGADFQALFNLKSFLGTPPLQPQCSSDTSIHAAVISLNTQIATTLTGNIRPSGMLVEFIQNGNVIASRPFPDDDATIVYFYLPAGDYQVSLRVDPSFRYKALKFHFTPTQSGNGFIVSGTTVTIQKNVTYSIQATNFF